MKKQFKVITIAVLFVFLFTLFLSACSNTNNETTNTTTTSETQETQETQGTQGTQETQETQEAALTEDEKIAKYDPPITLTTVASIDASFMFPEGDSLENNAYSRFIEESLGIKVKYDWIVDSSQWDTKVALMFTSNEIPDFLTVGSDNFINLVNNDRVMDLTDIHKKWASNIIKGHTESFPDGFASAFVNGRQYAFPGMGFGIIAEPSILWMRDDWLQQSGLKVPKTIDELETLALTFMDQHPGSYGLGITNEFHDGSGAMNITAIANGHNAFFETWIKKDGEIVYGSIQPEMKQTLSTLQSWYEQGIIHQEFGVKDANKVLEDLTAGKVGIQTGKNWNGWWPLTDSQEKGADWMAYPVPTLDGSMASLQAGWPVSSFIVINKDCEHPEAIYKLMNLGVKAEREGVFGVPEYQEINAWSYPCRVADPLTEEKDYKAWKKALENDDPSDLTPSQKTEFDSAYAWKTDKDIRGYGRYIQAMSVYPTIQEYVDANKVLMTELRGADPKGYAAIKSTLGKLEMDAFTKIIMGAPLDEEFEKFVKQWLELGGEAATKEINDIYNK